MIFNVIHFAKQCMSGYINIVQYLPTSNAKSCIYLAYNNEQIIINTNLPNKFLTRSIYYKLV